MCISFFRFVLLCWVRDIRIFGTWQMGHTIHHGHQRLQCWPFPNKTYHGYNREDFVFTRPPGVKRFVLADSVWYGCLKLLFKIAVKIDGQEEPVEIECAYVSFCHEIKLEPSCPSHLLLLALSNQIPTLPSAGHHQYST